MQHFFSFGFLFIILLEFKHFFKGMEWHKAFFYAFFQSATTRSGGLATMDLSDFTSPTLIVISLLMFIGASPSSVGGGIRTTTFAINILFLFHFARGKRSIKIFNREIHEDDISKALAVMFFAIILCFISIMVFLFQNIIRLWPLFSKFVLHLGPLDCRWE